MQTPYGDVASSNTHHDSIMALAGRGVFNGTDCGPGRFCPDDPVDRATMAVWVVRILDGQDPSPGPSRFPDVDSQLPAFWPPFIERLAELEVTEGCGDGTNFCPFDPVTRAQMAVFLTRAFDLPDGPDPGFSDVPAGAWYEDQVAALAASGITRGCATNPDRYCPEQSTTRAQMAAFLSRALPPPPAASKRDALLEPIRPAPLAQGQMGQDAAVGDKRVDVHYCGPESSRFDQAELDATVASLNAVGLFYRRESSGQLRLRFETGNIAKLSNTIIDWSLTLGHWRDEQARGGNKYYEVDRCKDALGDDTLVGAQPTGTKSLILADIQSGEIAGFAWRNGPGFVATDLGSDLLATTAHEIGHILGLLHIWDTQPRFCIYINDLAMSEDQQMDDYIASEEARECTKALNLPRLPSDELDDLRRSIMSYPDFGALRSLSTAYVACIQKILPAIQWVDSCEDAESSAPSAPQHLFLTSDVEALTVSWDPPASDGGEEITGYDVQFRVSGSRSWIDWQNGRRLDGTADRVVIDGLVGGTAYDVQVRARNSIGPGPWTHFVEATTHSRRDDDDTGPEPRVILQVGDPVQGRSDCTGSACRWLHIELVDFEPGPHTLACAHNGVPQAGFSRGVWKSISNAQNGHNNEVCYFGYPGSEVFVVVGAELRDGSWHGGTYSNIVEWRRSPPEPPEPPRPGAIIDDDPSLHDEVDTYNWWEPPAHINGLGYDGDFRFTLAIGNDDTVDSWARWDFDGVEVDGSYELQAWVPSDWATAHVQYRIWADENGDGRFTSDEYVGGPWMDQQAVSGWQSLGRYDLRGRVRVEVHDSRARDDHRVDGPVNTRIAADALSLVPAGESPPTACSDVVNDSPRLFDEVAPDSWWEPPASIARLGYGGDFHFTLAIGNSSDNARDNWAAWDFNAVNGRCGVEAWIPADWATAHVQYRIWADENGDGRFTTDEFVAGPWLDQQQVSGWQTLGTYNLRGRVRIEVRDTGTRDDHRDDGPINTRLAVDAIRLRGVSN